MQHKWLLIFYLGLCGLLGVYGTTQFRFGNAYLSNNKYLSLYHDVYSLPSLQTPSNTNGPIPFSQYLDLDNSSVSISFPYESTFYICDYSYNCYANINQTIEEDQSYTFVALGASDYSGYPRSTPPDTLFVVEERPNPSPYGKSLVKFVNAVASSYSGNVMDVSIGNAGAMRPNVSVPFASSSDFVEFDGQTTSVTVVVYFRGSKMSLFVPLARHHTSVVYLRGDLAPTYSYQFEITTVEFTYPFIYPTPTAVPVSAPVSAPVSSPQPNSTLLRLVNAVGDHSADLEMGLYVGGSYQGVVSTATSLNRFGEYLAVTSEQDVFLTIYDNQDNYGTYASVHFRAGMTHSYVLFNNSIGLLIEDYPVTSDLGSTYVRYVNAVHNTTIRVQSQQGSIWIPYGGLSEFIITADEIIWFEATTDYHQISQNVELQNGTATTIYIIGQENYFSAFIDAHDIPSNVTLPNAVCVNGYIESNGVCNCYSGYYSSVNNLSFKCTQSSYWWCSTNEPSELDNSNLPTMNWWDVSVTNDRLSFSIFSSFVKNRRTLIELPNAACNFLNSPSYYTQGLSDCYDRFAAAIPFVECGFTKTETDSHEIYEGTVLVKQIDKIVVDASTVFDRVIETPFPISIRLSKQLTLQSQVTVFGPPNIAFNAAFVGQQVNTEDRSGRLQYATSVPYPLEVESVQVISTPAGVYAQTQVTNINCTNATCVQRVDVFVDTASCSLSGVYRFAVVFGCRTPTGCPDDVLNGNATHIMQSSIVSKNLCDGVQVDINLQGAIRAYSDPQFNTPNLAFTEGQSAYFLISTQSSQVSITQVSLYSVYYSGPNVPGQYLSQNSNPTALALQNNFRSGSLGASKAWFGIDVSVNTPDVSSSALFKINRGQSGVYNFVAVVDVEWLLDGEASSNSTMKKRFVLQDGSEFTTQVQIAGSTSEEPSSKGDTVSSGLARGVSGSCFILVAIFLALF